MVDTMRGGTRSKKPESASPAPDPGRAQGRNATAATVLIIEDDAIIAMAVAEELSQNGFTVVGQADNGPEAIELAARHRPDVIVVDVRLRGEMNGIVAARRIKESRPTRVVFASAHIDTTTRGAMEAVGYDAIVAKPYTPEQLVEAVRDAVGR